MCRELTFENKNRIALYNNLKRLNKDQFKIFYGAFVHYWAKNKFFISKQNLFNLRCELNQLCHELDESFPDQYDDYELMKSFFLAHPYYYMDILPIELMAKLFSEYVDDRIDILSAIAKTIFETDICTTYTYANNALGLNEQIDIVATQAQNHIEDFS
ncbi:MAG: hypothetical protein IJ403_04145 [Oscillospiraceae bacterium]|nr:hypothetical protein [Oscillospiraceae bacterium]